MLKLNLPNPSPELLVAVQETVASDIPNYVPGYEYLLPNVADGIYFYSKISELGKEQYQPLFDEEIFVMGMILRPYPWENGNTNYVSSCYRPHCDGGRIIGFNYILDCGGDNVTTTMYTKFNDNKEEMGHVLNYDEVTPIRSYHLDKNTWYCLDAARYHSVENIEHDRLLLTISSTTLSFSEFIIKYSHLIDKVI